MKHKSHDPVAAAQEIEQRIQEKLRTAIDEISSVRLLLTEFLNWPSPPPPDSNEIPRRDEHEEMGTDGTS